METNKLTIIENIRELKNKYKMLYGLDITNEDVYNIVDLYFNIQGIPNLIANTELQLICHSLINTGIIEQKELEQNILGNERELLSRIIERFPMLKDLNKEINKIIIDPGQWVSRLMVTDEDMILILEEINYATSDISV